MDMQPGQNTALAGGSVKVSIDVQNNVSGLELDASAFMLTESGKVTDDSGMVFYGQPKSKDGSVSVDASGKGFDIELSRVPANITRIAIALTVDQGLKRGHRFGMLSSVAVNVTGGGDPLRFAPSVHQMSETALILGEVYQRNGQWKFRAVGQGFNGGLGPLARHFGVNISDDPDAGAPAAAATPPPAAAAPPPAPAPAAASTVNLAKITLEKKKPISLQKEGGRFGEIVINLNWSRPAKSSGFGSLFKGNKGVDLDLGCMLEHRNGQKGVIQALGNSFGSLREPPFVQLMGDDRTGDSTAGEFLHINGDQWSAFKRVLIYAFIYEGVPNWAAANGVVTIKMPGQPELEARMDSHESGKNTCAIAMLENDGNTIRASKLVEYFSDQKQMDEHYGFGFNWRPGSK
jgi:tellurite resistance protein TerA